jgi:hypothetical protein
MLSPLSPVRVAHAPQFCSLSVWDLGPRFVFSTLGKPELQVLCVVLVLPPKCHAATRCHVAVPTQRRRPYSVHMLVLSGLLMHTACTNAVC